MQELFIVFSILETWIICTLKMHLTLQDYLRVLQANKNKTAYFTKPVQVT